MNSGWAFFGIASLICIGVFLNGLRFARMKTNPFTGKRVGPFAVEGSELPITSIQRIGRIQMVFAPIFWVFICALSFGLLGPVEGIQTISF